jgi:hypothetical protein
MKTYGFNITEFVNTPDNGSGLTIEKLLLVKKKFDATLQSCSCLISTDSAFRMVAPWYVRLGARLYMVNKSKWLDTTFQPKETNE